MPKVGSVGVKSFVVAVAVGMALGGIGRAIAADLPPPGGPPAAPAEYYPVKSAFKNWGGAYLGLNGGYAFGSSDWSVIGASTGHFNVSGFIIGATLGANFQFDAWVFGLEGDFDWSSLQGSSSVAGCAAVVAPIVGTACQTKSDWLSTARVRVGYAFDRFLVFATGGLALNDLIMTLPGLGITTRDVEAGWTAGAGFEYAFTDNWTAKVEYLYVDFGKLTCLTSTSVCANSPAITLNENVIRAGVNYKLNW